MEVRISDAELANGIAVGLAVTGKRGQSKDARISILHQLGRYDLFRDAQGAGAMSNDVPLFADDFGITRAADVFEQQLADRKARRRDFDWPLKIGRRA